VKENPLVNLVRIALAALIVCVAAGTSAGQAPRKPADASIAATVETTFATESGRIRQFAFDGDPATYFASSKNPTKADHFTLVFDKPVSLKSVAVTTGRPKSGDTLEAGTLEVSADGKNFEELAKFAEGTATGDAKGRKVLAVRVRPADDMTHPLAIREIAVESEPPVAAFKYPVEFVVDVSDAPDMKEWAEKVAKVCERQYAMISEELRGEGFKPPTVVTMTLKNNYNGVAATGGGRITGSVKYFKAHPDDVGAMVHETVHVVQRYFGRNNPGWLVEGVADYVRFFKYEPGKLGRINTDRAHYNGSYRVTAAFLAHLTDKHDKEIVRKLNAAMREGKYKPEMFKDLTGKTLDELDEEWRATLPK
jgi:hypothetical protein